MHHVMIHDLQLTKTTKNIVWNLEIKSFAVVLQSLKWICGVTNLNITKATIVALCNCENWNCTKWFKTKYN